jgi:Raf kinase inhibitor-like YbhB/YbcL family protein
VDTESSDAQMKIHSPAFADGGAIPQQYTCKGQNISPQLDILDVPKEAKSLSLIMHDPDAPVGDFVHWLIWDIPANTATIATNNLPVGAVQGKTGFNENKYGGPCPPSGSGTHRYMFELYALDNSLNLNSGCDREKLQEAMEGHAIAQAVLTGLVAADS